MTKVTVKFVHDCCNWKAGAIESLEYTRAHKLVRIGYAEFIETATVEPTERAEQARPATRGPRAERRG